MSPERLRHSPEGGPVLGSDLSANTGTCHPIDLFWGAKGYLPLCGWGEEGYLPLCGWGEEGYLPLCGCLEVGKPYLLLN